MRKDFSATETPESPLRLLTRRPNYMSFPGQLPTARIATTFSQPSSGNRPTLSISPRRRASRRSARSFHPSPTLTGTGSLRILRARTRGRRWRVCGTRIGRVFFNGLRATSSSSLDPTSISHVSPVQDSPTPASPASSVQSPRTIPIHPSRR